jgi:hypothetical protein
MVLAGLWHSEAIDRSVVISPIGELTRWDAPPRASDADYASSMPEDPEEYAQASSAEQHDRSHAMPPEAAAALTATWQEILRVRHPEYAGLVVEMVHAAERAD